MVLVRLLFAGDYTPLATREAWVRIFVEVEMRTMVIVGVRLICNESKTAHLLIGTVISASVIKLIAYITKVCSKGELQ